VSDKEKIWCDDCNKYHVDGDTVVVNRSQYVIAVKCMKHAVWANRKAIQSLYASIRKDSSTRVCDDPQD
jgi:hypothetical protein